MKSKITTFALLFLAFGTLHAQDDKYSFKENYDISSPAYLNVAVSDGDVTVVPGKNGSIEVLYIVYFNNHFVDISKEELGKYMILDFKHNENTLNISVHHRKPYNRKNRYEVSLKIYTPVQTLCNLKSSDGDIEVSGLKADQKCKTSDGDIVMKNISGNLDLHTSDGDIDISKISGDIILKTSDGDVIVSGAEGTANLITSDGDIKLKEVTGAISAETSDGDITIRDCNGSLSAITSDGDIRGNLLKVTNKLSFRTSDGDINITIPSGLGLNLKAKGETLRIPLMNFSGSTEDHRIEGTINGGGIPVEFITTDGTITLSYL